MKDINLLPEELKQKNLGMDELRDKLDPKKILTGIIIVFSLAIVFVAPLLYNKILENSLKVLQAELVKPEYEPLKALNVQIVEQNGKVDLKKKVISQIDRSTLTLSEVYSTVKGILPEGVNLTKLSFDKSELEIAGNVQEAVQIGEIISRAQRIKYFVLDEEAIMAYGQNREFKFVFKIASQNEVIP